MRKDLLIGDVAARTGLDRKTVRYYEEVGLIPKPKRKNTSDTFRGYRLYSEGDVERLRLIKGARLLDLSLAEIRQLLPSLNGQKARSGLAPILREKLDAIDRKMRDLQLLRDRIEHIQNVIGQEKVETDDGCCDPLCAPDICPPPLVQIETSKAKERPNPRKR